MSAVGAGVCSGGAPLTNSGIRKNHGIMSQTRVTRPGRDACPHPPDLQPSLWQSLFIGTGPYSLMPQALSLAGATPRRSAV